MYFFEDLTVGQVFENGPYEMSEAVIIEFARAYDPQAMHTDPEAAKQMRFGKLIASGWHTAAATMKLMATSALQIPGGMLGMGAEYIRWPIPTYVDDVLKTRITVREKRASGSRPSHGIVTIDIRTLNQNDQPVLEMATPL